VYTTATHDPTNETKGKDLAAKGRGMFFKHLRQQSIKEAFYFFEGSEIFAARPLPFITDYPHTIQGKDDQMELRIIKITEFESPEDISGPEDRGDSVFHSSGGKTFATDAELKAHCEKTGETENIITIVHPAKPRNDRLIKNASLVLSRKMEEAYQKWEQHFLAIGSKQEHGSLTVYQGTTDQHK
jgi:hypothetical protein